VAPIQDGAKRDYRCERHSVSRLIVHLVCVTKYRRQVFDAAALEWLAGHARPVRAKVCRLLASGGEVDHLHILVPADAIRFRCWSTPSRARQVEGFAGTGQTWLAIATVLCGPISLRRLAALRSSSSRSSNRTQFLLALVCLRLPRAEKFGDDPGGHSNPCLLLPSRGATIHPTPRQQTLFPTCFP
jgi:hypothetical protein